MAIGLELPIARVTHSSNEKARAAVWSCVDKGLRAHRRVVQIVVHIVVNAGVSGTSMLPCPGSQLELMAKGVAADRNDCKEHYLSTRRSFQISTLNVTLRIFKNDSLNMDYQ